MVRRLIYKVVSGGASSSHWSNLVGRAREKHNLAIQGLQKYLDDPAGWRATDGAIFVYDSSLGSRERVCYLFAAEARKRTLTTVSYTPQKFAERFGGDGGEEMIARLAEAESVQVFILREVQDLAQNEEALTRLYEILNRRRQDGLLTLITGDKTSPDYKQLPARITTRLFWGGYSDSLLGLM